VVASQFMIGRCWWAKCPRGLSFRWGFKLNFLLVSDRTSISAAKQLSNLLLPPEMVSAVCSL
jgi:hypothetical protein